MRKRALAFFICMTMLLTMFGQNYIPVIASSEPVLSSSVLYEGKVLRTLELPQNEKRTVTASSPAEMGDCSYQWQILADAEEELWVNISGQEAQSLEVSHALLTGILDDGAEAYLRCAVTAGGGVLYTEPVSVTVTDPVKEEKKTDAESQPEEPVLINGWSVEEKLPEEAPVEETTEETASTEETAAESAPTEERTTEEAPAEETRKEEAPEEKVPAEEESKESDASEMTAPEEAAKVQAVETELLRASAAASEYVNITVNYLDEVTREPLYNPYTAQLQPGTNFSRQLTSPTFLGFAPYWNPDNPGETDPNQANTSAEALDLMYTNLTTDQTVNVYYKAMDVSYGVRYFFQNVNDDLYTEDAARYYMGTAKTGTLIDDEDLKAQAGDTEGFTFLYHYPESVAADGSTVFECYYDRNYYLMKFDMAGGYGVEPIYARFRSPFLVSNPSRPGYTFVGWDDVTDSEDDGQADVLPTTIPASNKSYKAIWRTATTSVTYVYWLENVNDEGYSYWNSYSEDGYTPGEKISGEDNADTVVKDPEIQYYTFVKADQDVVVKNDGTTIVNMWYRRKVYKLRFYIAMYENGKYWWSEAKKAGDYTTAFDKSGKNTDQDPVKWQAFLAGAIPEQVGNRTYYYLELEGKYGQNIADQWPANGPYMGTLDPSHPDNFGNIGYVCWEAEEGSPYAGKPNEGIKGPYQTMSSELIYHNGKVSDGEVFAGVAMNFVMYCNNGRDSLQYKLYFQTLEEAEDGTVTVVEPAEPQLIYNIYKDKGPGNQETYIFEGYKEPKVTNVSNIITAKYELEQFRVDVYNQGEKLQDLDILRYYSQALKLGTEIPDMNKYYPKNLEPGAYVFDGFYTSPEFSVGTEVKDTDKMPASDIQVYAKWKPVTRTVHFFISRDTMETYQKTGDPDLLFVPEITIPHGSLLDAIKIPHDPDGVYQFTGWFYLDHGVKTAFTPADMPVVKDLDIFADWSSNYPEPFEIRYVIKGTDTEIAERMTGFERRGVTRTFRPKAGDPYNQLYPEYARGYFPLVSSHSITMKPEPDPEHLQENLYTFEYVQAANLSYRVRYVDKLTGLELAEPKMVNNVNEAVITERFKPIPEYLPDAFYKRLVLSVEEDENGNIVSSPDNEIIFYYTPNPSAAYYAVHYMLQRPDTTGKNYAIDGTGDYEEADTHSEGVTSETSIDVPAPDFTGYTVVSYPAVLVQPSQETNPEITQNADGTFTLPVEHGGTELYIFYTLNEYPYVMEYRDYATKADLLGDSSDEANYNPKKYKTGGTAYYGTVVTEQAPSEGFEGYSLLGEEEKTITIRAYDGTDLVQRNVIIFYYVKTSYTVQYQVWSGGGGTLSHTLETVSGNGAFTGSAPTPDKNYQFVGWYLDEACTTPVGDKGSIDADGKLMPYRDKLLPEPGNNIFYAKFIELKGDSKYLTISRENAADEGEGSQVFVYKVTKAGEAPFYVTVTGNGTTTISGLDEGSYTVEQQNGWSWRYADAAQEVTLGKEDREKTVTFEAKAEKDKWLTGNSSLKKNQMKEGRP